MELISLKFGMTLLKSPINKDKFIIGYYDDNGKFKVVKDENNECEICVKSGDYFDYYDLMIKYFNYIKKLFLLFLKINLKTQYILLISYLVHLYAGLI